jgi:hypothetical protein
MIESNHSATANVASKFKCLFSLYTYRGNVRVFVASSVFINPITFRHFFSLQREFFDTLAGEKK